MTQEIPGAGQITGVVVRQYEDGSAVIKGPGFSATLQGDREDAEDFLSCFAQLVAEECAKLCEEKARSHFQMSPAAVECDDLAAAIRAKFGMKP